MIRDDGSIADELTDAAKIVQFRNRIVHGYHAIDDGVVWIIITDNLQTLGTEAASLLSK